MLLLLLRPMNICCNFFIIEKGEKSLQCIDTLFSIVQLCTHRPRNLFEGDVLVLHDPGCGKNVNSLTKIELVHFNLFDRHG
jgi:hypothetical protein